MCECVSEHQHRVLSFTWDHDSSFLVRREVGVVDSRQQLDLIVKIVAYWVLVMSVASLVEYTDWNSHTNCFVRLVGDASLFAFDPMYCGKAAAARTLPCMMKHTNNERYHWLLSIVESVDCPMSLSMVLAVEQAGALRLLLLQQLV